MFPFLPKSNQSVICSENHQLTQQLEKINKELEFATQYYQGMDNGAGFSELSALNQQKQTLEHRLSRF
jgi:hypothetical protein